MSYPRVRPIRGTSLRSLRMRLFMVFTLPCLRMSSALVPSSCGYNADHLLSSYRVALVITILETTFEDKLGVQLDTISSKGHNDYT